eukprot:4989340-Pyramimonas_sp.AAC.1
MFRNVDHWLSRPFPWDWLVIPSCVLPAPGPDEGPQRPTQAKNLASCFFFPPRRGLGSEDEMRPPDM